MVIDIGNTSIEFGVHNGEKIIGTFRVTSKKEMSSDEIWVFIKHFVDQNHIPLDYITDVVISSVVPQVNYSVSSAVRKYLKKEPKIIGENLSCPMKTKYDKQRELGIDRLVDAYAAYEKIRGAVVIVDFGTATTVDAVSADGVFMGGMIFPGILTATDALYSKAAKLPKTELLKPEEAIGHNTVECIQQGSYYGYIGAVERLIGIAKKSVGEDAKVIATGGFSRLFAEEKIFDFVLPNLQMDGIRMVLENEKRNT